MRMLMRCIGVLACFSLVLGACSDYPSTSEWKAPILSKDWNTVVELSDNVNFGDQVSGTFSTQKALTGFVFDAHQGARVTVTLDATNGDDLPYYSRKEWHASHRTKESSGNRSFRNP